jgi:hypothetical protein
LNVRLSDSSFDDSTRGSSGGLRTNMAIHAWEITSDGPRKRIQVQPRGNTAVKLFDIRSDDSHAGFVEVVNRGLADEPGNAYLARFGPVCSARWWACFDRGELPVKVLSGVVTHAGPRLQEWGEVEDVVEFVCGGRVIRYDRVECWAGPIRIGDLVSVTRTVVEVPTRTVPMTYLIDLRAEWLPASNG